MIERGGDARLTVMERVTSAILESALLGNLDPKAQLMTGEAKAYKRVGKRFGGGHHTVLHKVGEYARGDVTTNTIEGAFSLLKRGMYGTSHSVSKRHLHRYLNEFSFRHNTRHLDDGERAAALVKAAGGKRLTYRERTRANA